MKRLSLVLCLTAAAGWGQTPTTLATFNYSNGAGPANVSLIQGLDGNLYGVTLYGGANDNCATYGCGTVFKITPGGTLTTLHSFDGTDGFIASGLMQAIDGNFYGTTSAGGSSPNCSGGCGTVFRITPGGALTTLHNFSLSDGANPWGPMVQARNGDFWGTTTSGGIYCVPYGCGTIFKITPGGTLTSVYSFNGSDGN